MKKCYVLVIATLLLAPTSVVQSTIRESVQERLGVAHSRFKTAKKVLGVPARVALAIIPVITFSYYAPTIVTGMGPMTAITAIGLGGLFSGIMGAEISLIFQK